MSELLWPMYHDLRKRLEAVETWIKQSQQAAEPPPEPTVPADYNDPTQTDTDEPEAPDAA